VFKTSINPIHIISLFPTVVWRNDRLLGYRIGMATECYFISDMHIGGDGARVVNKSLSTPFQNRYMVLELPFLLFRTPSRIISLLVIFMSSPFLSPKNVGALFAASVSNP
jgi:hypothetical protein